MNNAQDDKKEWLQQLLIEWLRPGETKVAEEDHKNGERKIYKIN